MNVHEPQDAQRRYSTDMVTVTIVLKSQLGLFRLRGSAARYATLGSIILQCRPVRVWKSI